MIQVQLKLRLRPSQERTLERWLRHLTAVYNWTIRKIELDGAAGIYHSKYDLRSMLVGHSAKLAVPKVAIEGAVWQAHSSWARCFRGLSRRPNLKGNRNRLNYILFTDANLNKISGNTIGVPLLGRVRFHAQDIPSGRVVQVRLILRSSGWYAALSLRSDPDQIKAITDGEVGIDPGFSRLLTLSSGEIVEHPREQEVGERRLAQAQRGRRDRLAWRIRERQANRRKDRNHKISRKLVAENALIAWSKDNTLGIARVFGKSVASSSHHQLRRLIAYKSRIGGRRFIEVASRNSTRRCSACGALSGPSGWRGLSVRRWGCACGAEHDRDVNAARNTLIAALGMSVESGREAASGIATHVRRRDSHAANERLYQEGSRDVR